MVIKTTRFGQVGIEATDILAFPEGLLGFAELRKFVLLDDPNDDIFAWLQSCEDSGVAFPVLEPELFTENFNVNLAKTDFEALKTTSLEGTRMLCIVTIPDEPTQMTANLKAPVIINVNERVARQCVLQDNSLAIREPIFTKLQARVLNNPGQSIKDQSQPLEVAVRIKDRLPDASL